MGAGFFQNLNNQGAAQNATQAPQYTMPAYQGGGYTTTQGENFNQTTPNAPYWGTYTAPMNINAPNTKVVEQPKYDNRGRLIKTTAKKVDKNQQSFDNPSPLPDYSMYIAPEQMPDINAYLQNPNSLLGAIQDSGIPSSGAGRYSSLLSTNNYTGNK